MFWNSFKDPTPEEMRARQLSDAQRALVDIEAAVEHNTAIRNMLVARIARLTQTKEK